MKRTMITLLAVFLTLNIVSAQEVAKQAVENAAQQPGPVDFTEMIGTDITLTPEQAARIREINQATWNSYMAVDDSYKTNNDVYRNRVRTLLEERDAKMKDVLTLDQYAIYLKNRAKYQEYDSKYYTDDLSLRKESDGKVKAKTDEGKIKITDDKVKIKNEEEGVKTKIKEDKVKVKTEDGDKIKVKQDEEKVKVKTEDGKIKVKEEGAEIKTDEKKIEIDDKDEDRE